MPVRLVAIDLDGTLLDSRGRLPEANRLAVGEARRRGVQVAVCTGRRFRDARPVALELGLDVPVIAHNGALTRHARKGGAGEHTVSAHLIALEAARNVVRLGLSLGADPFVCLDPHGPGLLAHDVRSQDSPMLLSYLRWSRRLSGTEPAVRCVEDLAERLDEEPVHIFFTGRCAEMAQVAAEVAAALGPRVAVNVTGYEDKDFALTDVLAPTASKGSGVAALAAELGVARAEVMAIGDNDNDRSMLEYAGTAVVMENAAASLRADRGTRYHATSSNDDAGVARALERFVLDPG